MLAAFAASTTHRRGSRSLLGTIRPEPNRYRNDAISNGRYDSVPRPARRLRDGYLSGSPNGYVPGSAITKSDSGDRPRIPAGDIHLFSFVGHPAGPSVFGDGQGPDAGGQAGILEKTVRAFNPHLLLDAGFEFGRSAGRVRNRRRESGDGILLWVRLLFAILVCLVHQCGRSLMAGCGFRVWVSHVSFRIPPFGSMDQSGAGVGANRFLADKRLSVVVGAGMLPTRGLDPRLVDMARALH